MDEFTRLMANGFRQHFSGASRPNIRPVIVVAVFRRAFFDAQAQKLLIPIIPVHNFAEFLQRKALFLHHQLLHRRKAVRNRGNAAEIVDISFHRQSAVFDIAAFFRAVVQQQRFQIEPQFLLLRHARIAHSCCQRPFRFPAKRLHHILGCKAFFIVKGVEKPSNAIVEGIGRLMSHRFRAVAAGHGIMQRLFLRHPQSNQIRDQRIVVIE